MIQDDRPLTVQVDEYLLSKYKTTEDNNHVIHRIDEGVHVIFGWVNEECGSCRNPNVLGRTKNAVMAKLGTRRVCTGCRTLAGEKYLERQQMIVDMARELNLHSSQAYMGPVPAFPAYPERYRCFVSAA